MKLTLFKSAILILVFGMSLVSCFSDSSVIEESKTIASAEAITAQQIESDTTLSEGEFFGKMIWKLIEGKSSTIHITSKYENGKRILIVDSNIIDIRKLNTEQENEWIYWGDTKENVDLSFIDFCMKKYKHTTFETRYVPMKDDKGKSYNKAYHRSAK